jgi:hypothetical protein
VANTLRPKSIRALVLVEQLPAHGRAISLRALKVRNAEEPAVPEKQFAAFGVNIYGTDTEIEVIAVGSTNVEQML